MTGETPPDLYPKPPNAEPTLIFDMPFEGITYFEHIDGERKLVKDQGKPGEPGWLRYEYYPRTDHARFIKQNNRPGAKFFSSDFVPPVEGFYYGDSSTHSTGSKD